MNDRDNSDSAAACEVTVAEQMPDWDGFLRDRPDATIYHDPRWGELMLRAYGNRPVYLTARRNGKISGVLQLAEQKSRLFGSHLCSLPYFDAAGILADDAPSTIALVDAARGLIDDRRVEWVELRHFEAVDDSIPARTDKVTMHLALPDSQEELWDSFKTKVRTKVRRAEKNDVSIDAGKEQYVDDFYDVYTRTMRDLGSPPHNRRFFRLLAELFAQEMETFVVRMDGQPVAASLILIGGTTLHVPWSGTDLKLRNMNINMVLYWTMLSHACKGGLKRFDFGRSTRDSGTYVFKKQWGSEEVPLTWQFLLPAGRELPDLSPDSPKYRMMVSCWKKLPLWATRMLGHRIISRLS